MEKQYFASIPTKYNGIQFRSRLEARWACFFDLCKWRWEYESIDLKGWIPDFVLIGKTQQILVEVKPFFSITEFDETIKKNEKAQELSNTTYEMLYLGAIMPQSKESYPTLGWLSECMTGNNLKREWCTEEALLGYKVTSSNKYDFDFFHSYQSYKYRLSDIYDGNGHLSTYYNNSVNIIKSVTEAWIEAGNYVQWKKE